MQLQEEQSCLALGMCEQHLQTTGHCSPSIWPCTSKSGGGCMAIAFASTQPVVSAASPNWPVADVSGRYSCRVVAHTTLLPWKGPSERVWEGGAVSKSWDAPSLLCREVQVVSQCHGSSKWQELWSHSPGCKMRGMTSVPKDWGQQSSPSPSAW